MSEFIVLNNEVPSICEPCGGSCCKGMPGATLPEHFGAPDEITLFQNLANAFSSGKWAVDWWEGDPRLDLDELGRAMYVRPATKGTTRIYDASWGGECVMLTSTGCSLRWSDRPHNCQTLVPDSGGNCIGPHAKDFYAIAWLPYQTVIDMAVEASR